MEKEQIIKALEYCTRGRKGDDIPCPECPYNECNIVGGTSERQTKGSCQWWLMKDATALIKELTAEIADKRAIGEMCAEVIKRQDNELAQLTEENERLQKAKYIYATVDYCADDLAKALEENKRLTEECERLTKKIEMSEAAYQGLQFALSVCANQVKADTVREIKTRFALRYGTYTDKYMTPITEVFWLLDRIANEILNNTEDEEK
jgi:hypothetical protein